MKSLIRSDFYKLRKAKSFWVCMILAVALAVFSVLIMDFSVKLMDKVPQQAAQEEAALEESGLNISTDGIPMSSADLNASNMLLMQFAGTTTILISIFVSLFVGGEFSHGTIKNLASKNHTRTQIYLSKIIVSVIAAIVMTLLYAVVATGLGTALWGFGKVDSSFVANACKGIGIEFLLVSAFTAVFVMFSMLIRQSGEIIAHEKKKRLDKKIAVCLAGAAVVLAIVAVVIAVVANRPEKKKPSSEKPKVTEEQKSSKKEEQKQEDTDTKDPEDQTNGTVDEPVSEPTETDYIFPNSGTTELTREEVQGHTKEELRIARNEIYARHGAIFGVDDLDAYFQSKSWYTPTLSISELLDTVELSMVEENNISLISEIESGM